MLCNSTMPDYPYLHTHWYIFPHSCICSYHKIIPQFIIDTVLTSTIHDTCTHLHTYIQLVLCNTSIIVDMLIIHQITLTHELDSILNLFSYLYCSSLLFHSLFAGHLVFLVPIVPCEACHQSLMISHCM